MRGRRSRNTPPPLPRKVAGGTILPDWRRVSLKTGNHNCPPPPNTNNTRTQIPKQASTTTASSSRSRTFKSTSRALAMRGSSAVSGTRSGASANSRGKRRRAEGGDPHEAQAVVSQASPSGAGSRKRRLPAWASAASSGREGYVSL